VEAYILKPGADVLSRNIDDYPEGIIIPIDKPYRWTSADVIRKVKYAAIRHFGKKNLKVGHAGTLDPLATGVLLVCIGKATKLAETLQSHDKEYVAGITFGATTPSYDLEKEIDRFFPYEHISAEGVAEALPAFIGEQDQIAPLFSAKSVDGVRAYELARKLYRTMNRCDSDDPRLSDDRHPLAGGGMSSPSQSLPDTESVQDFDAAAKDLIRVSRINISELEMVEFHNLAEDSRLKNNPSHFVGPSSSDEIQPENISKASARINVTDNSELGLPRAVVRIACSKGTYVRAFARDLGEALGSGAHLDSLQRSRSGEFRVENALTVEQTIALLS
jgi:tRNA pseudouridine55 synthase